LRTESDAFLTFFIVRPRVLYPFNFMQPHFSQPSFAKTATHS
jgi:hypothetical protein